MRFSAIIFAVMGTVAGVQAEGIDCEGNGNCASQGTNILISIHNATLALNQGNKYIKGQHIFCAGGTGNACAFYQHLQGLQGSGTAAQAAQHVQNLLNHG